MPVLRRIGLATMLLCLSTHTAHAQMLTFDEPQSSQAMTNAFNGLHTLYFSAIRRSAICQSSIVDRQSALCNRQ
jgi:hypothetical protein